MRFIVVFIKSLNSALTASLPYKQTCLRSIDNSQDCTQGLRASFIHQVEIDIL
jgi:hypothetical protein